MARRRIWLLVLWVCALVWLAGVRTHAQSSGRQLTLRVLSAEDGRAITGVICSVWDSVHRRTGFAQTDREGRATLTLRPSDHTLTLVLMGYRKRELLLSSPELSVAQPTLRLEVEEVKLREVYVRATPITPRGDTLSYRIKTFAGAQDRYIEDVLRKLPGIEVGTNGQIRYQGKAIDKFYIEGQDPLGANYNQASRNLPADAVDRVEVIEHNQHKRILQGKVVGEQAALNIRLNKKALFRPFGELMGGTGLEPPLWTGKAFLMQVAPSNQLITNLRGNNIGQELATDFVEHTSPYPEEDYQPLPHTILSTSGNTPPLSEGRYLRNQALSWGVNDLQRVGQYGSLRLNVLGYHDRTRGESTQAIRYLGTTPYDLHETSGLVAKPNYYRAALHYEHNAPGLFLLADMLYSTQGKTSREELLSDSKVYQLTLRQRPQWLQASLQGNVSLGGTLISLKSSTRGYTAGERLSGWQRDPAGIETALTTRRRVSQFATTNSARMGFALGRANLQTGLLARATYNGYGVHELLSPSDNSYSQLTVGLNNSLSYSSPRVNVSLSCPLYYQADRLWLGRQLDRRAYLHLAPSLSLRLMLSQYSTLLLSGGYQSQPDIDDYYSAGVIRRGYRSYTQSLQQLYYRHELNGAARLTYRNPLELFFAYVRLSYRQTAHSYLRDIRLRPEQTLSIPIDTAYRHQSYSVQGVLDKAIPHWALTLRAELGYTHNRHLTALAERIYAVRSDNLLSMLTLRWSRIPALSASYSVGLGSLWYHRSGMEPHPSLRLEQELKLVGTLSKLFSLSALLQHTMGEEGTGRGYRHTLFCDVQADWVVSKRVRLAGSLTNLWNERVYSLTSISTTQIEHYTLPLRPREFVLSCTIRL